MPAERSILHWSDQANPHTNVRTTYGSITIPRHLRDIVVTEYGIADVRGRTDQDVATALIEVADSRFQDGLLHEAQQSGKVLNRYRIPDSCRGNRPEKLEQVLAPYRARGLFPPFRFGTDLTNEEVVLKRALAHLKHAVTHKAALIPRRAVSARYSLCQSALAPISSA